MNTPKQPEIDKSTSRPDLQPKVGDPMRDPSPEKRKHDPDPSHDAKPTRKDKSRDKQKP